ncbi:MAG: pantetheine-phosphate adenylyltransferase [Nitrospirae bacterium]|nr:pantetheine-phosphate adenylyltransferase [Nitrospirota bacterium]
MKGPAVYPGTFDPITNGHIDLIHRTLRIFDRVIVAIAPSLRKAPFFTAEERLEMAREATRGMRGVQVETFDGLLVAYVRRMRGVAVIRGLRAVSDFEFELQMALMNRRLDHAVETVFMMPSEEYTFLTSSIVKEVASVGGSVKGLVPPAVERHLKARYGKKTRP